MYFEHFSGNFRIKFSARPIMCHSLRLRALSTSTFANWKSLKSINQKRKGEREMIMLCATNISNDFMKKFSLNGNSFLHDLQ
jgi:hypothetical protein